MESEDSKARQAFFDVLIRQLGLGSLPALDGGARSDILESLRVALLYVVDGAVAWANSHAEKVLEYEAGGLVGKPFDEIVVQDSQREGVIAGEEELRAAGGGFEGTCRLYLRDGQPRWFKVHGGALELGDGSYGSIWGLEDMTALFHEATESLRLTAAIFEASNEGMLISDPENRVLMVNPSFSKITGYAPEDVIGNNPSLLSSGRHDAAFYHAMWEEIASKGRWSGEIWNRRKNGSVYPENLTITAVKGADGEVENYLAVFSDISRHKQDQEIILYQANYDALTDLPNRQLVQDRIHQALIQAQRESFQSAVLYVDLDNFKVINDSLGHTAGDALLAEMSLRMKDCLREQDTLGRLGADEFLVLLPRLHSADEIVAIARRILERVSKPMNLEGRAHDLVMTASIGIAVYPNDGGSTDMLIRNADTAVSHAKQQGRNQYKFFTDDMNARSLERLDLENKLRYGIEREELILHFQPKVELRHGRVSGAEALVRWEHPVDGLIPPDKFIPVAEDTGLVIALGEWVLKAACVQAREWLESGIFAGRMAVNVSARQLGKKDLLDVVERAVNESGLPIKHLELEITESSIMENLEDTLEVLWGLRDMGAYLTVDDFGTGYSSLSYLKDFPIDALKIDRAFVKDIGTGKGGEKLAAAIIAIGQGLGLKVTAEGVETTDHLSFLRQQWCDEIQGYYFSKPLSADDFVTLIETNPRL